MWDPNGSEVGQVGPTCPDESHLGPMWASCQGSLYLQCMGEVHCTGYFVIRQRSKLYKAELTQQQSCVASEWSRYRAIVDGEKILHHYNHIEVSVGAKHVRVDGIVPENRVVYQFHGCYRNGHKCQPDKQALSTQSGLALMVECCTDTLRTIYT